MVDRDDGKCNIIFIVVIQYLVRNLKAKIGKSILFLIFRPLIISISWLLISRGSFRQLIHGPMPIRLKPKNFRKTLLMYQLNYIENENLH